MAEGATSRLTAAARDALVADLVAALGADAVTTSPSELERHGTDESSHAPVPPDVVAYAGSVDDVVAVVRACRAHGAPLVPFGAGTSLEGHVAALAGGVSLDLSRLRRILRVSPEDLDASVEAGVTRLQLEARLRDDGLFFPVDPGADATLGGMAATGASGTLAVRYGTMRENVLSLTAVMADGSVVRTRSRARKSSAGYDLTRLLVGSEGTLGVICELTLRLQPLPAAVVAAVCAFPSVHDAVAAATETIQCGLPVARVELLDALQMEAVARRSGLPHPARPTLLVELHGTPAAIAEQADLLGEVVAGHGAEGYAWSADEAERRRLWAARHEAHPSTLALRPGSRAVATDVCVPISELARCIDETGADIAESGLVVTTLGHVGDGNFHLTILVDPDDPGEVARADALHERMVRRALAAGGTCTGEHGVGYGKAAYLALEHDPGALALMRTIKRALDPDDLLNPGKVLPPEIPPAGG